MPGRRRPLIHRQLWLVTFLLLSVFAGACGGSGVDREFSIIGGASKEDADLPGGFAFVGEDITGSGPTIRVQAGDQVTITFEHSGENGAHDFAIVTDKDRFALVEPFLERVKWEAATSILLPGESERIAFTPDTPGTYYYICTVPGHVLGGMWGEFVVEE